MIASILYHGFVLLAALAFGWITSKIFGKIIMYFWNKHLQKIQREETEEEFEG